jgi:D-beta-D-heptose 7-phosphate kinase/D-beta-D-heptose 1-phosphate adenosyltransferase
MDDMGRVVEIEELLEVRADAKRSGRVFVFTNGCFDILHRGHIEILKQARALGDLLVVAVNSDASVRRLKGERRPVVRQEDRTAVLAALESVDYVTIFEEDTPAQVIARLRPDVLVKGSDYTPQEVVGREDVEGAGGRVVIVPLHGDFSTERMLREIARRYGDAPVGDT